MGVKSGLKGSCRLLLDSGLQGRPMPWRKGMLGAVFGRSHGDGETWIMLEWFASGGGAFGLTD